MNLVLSPMLSDSLPSSFGSEVGREQQRSRGRWAVPYLVKEAGVSPRGLHTALLGNSVPGARLPPPDTLGLSGTRHGGV
jgi:hypothetical protein